MFFFVFLFLKKQFRRVWSHGAGLARKGVRLDVIRAQPVFRGSSVTRRSKAGAGVFTLLVMGVPVIKH